MLKDGRSDEHLRSIGVYYLSNLHAAVPPQSFKTIVFGQLEGEAGYKWDDDRVYSGIRQIIVIYGDHAIDSINIEYDNNGSPFWLELGVSAGNNPPIRSEPGVRAGNKIGKIRLHYPHEILTSISGHHDTYLRSLTFESNLGKIYGPYGSQRGTPFESPRGDWKIVGFHGRSAPYLDFQDRSGSHFYCIGVSLSFSPKSVKPISVGPWGGEGGDMWDDGVYSGIHQIIIVYDQEASAIASIDIQYDNNGSLVWLEHGGSTGNKIEKIQLDYPNESLTSISGSYDDTSGIIRRLTFESNSLKEYGPYGIQAGTHYFSSPNEDVKIVGFHGRSDEYLRSIGVYYLPNLHTQVSLKEYPPEGEHAGIGGEPSFNRRVGRESPREGEPALIVGESLYGSARQARRAGKKEEEKAERKKEEGSRASEEEDTRAFEPESPREGEPALIVGESLYGSARQARRAGKKEEEKAERKKEEGSRASEEEDTRAFEPESPREGEPALIVGESLYGSARQARRAGKKEEEKAERKKEEGSRASEEEDTRAFEPESPREGEPALIVGESLYGSARQARRAGKKEEEKAERKKEEGSRASEEEDTRAFEPESPREGEPALIVGESLYGSARQARRAGKKEEEKAERKKEEGSRASEEEDTRAFEPESPREGEPALIVGESLYGSARQARRAGKKEEEKAERKKEEGSRASEEEDTRAFEPESPREGEPALIVGESLYESARQARRAGKKEEEKAERKKEEGSRASEEEDTRAFEPEYPNEGEPALIVGESLYASARQTRREGRREGKKEEKKAERKKEEGSRAREEEGGSRAREEEELKEEKEAEGAASSLSSLHI